MSEVNLSSIYKSLLNVQVFCSQTNVLESRDIYARMTYFNKEKNFFTDTPSENLPKFVIGIFLDMLALPFLFICSMSLYTKLLPKEIQGKLIVCCNRH